MTVRPALLVALVVLGCATNPSSRQPLESLSVRELNLVDENGQTRLRLAAPFPDPKGLKRKVKPVGIQLLDAEGKEVGGLVMIDSIGVRGLCFDAAANYEAMCVGLEQGKPTVTFRDDWKERLTLTVEGGVARITLFDAEGKPKLQLTVDQDGTPRVEGSPAPSAP